MSERGEGGPREIVLVRHAETEWSRAGRHTGRTDLALSEEGRVRAAALAPALARWRFERVLCSPARRARETCKLSGLAEGAAPRADLWEWDYGRYEGLTGEEIRAGRPGWNLWRDGAPDGESAQQVGERADRVLGELREVAGCVALFA
ncbi:MAG: histidine phosphatase family protein, partial [Solirubrobacterales bacterium]|nr:histidine phosphatase family protein [Solirubrobacterales bacterium]